MVFTAVIHIDDPRSKNETKGVYTWQAHTHSGADLCTPPLKKYIVLLVAHSVRWLIM